MLLNGSALNRAAINGSALLAILYAEASGAASVSHDVAGYKTQYAQVVADAAVVVTLAPEFTQVGRSSGTATATAFIQAQVTQAASASLSATASGVAFIYATQYAYAGGDGTATGYALANSKLGEWSATATAAGGAEPTLHQRVTASVNVSATGTATGDRTRNASVALQAGASGYADWMYLATGGTVWLHDGHAWASGGAVGLVDETKYKVVIGNGLVATAESSANVVAYSLFMAKSSAGCSAAGVFSPSKTSYAVSVASAGCSASVAAQYWHMPVVNATASAVYSQVVNGITQTQQAASVFSATATSSAAGVVSKFATASASGGIAGSANGGMTRLASFTASASVSVTTIAFANASIPATEERTMLVPADDRAMVAPFDDRLMRLAA